MPRITVPGRRVQPPPKQFQKKLITEPPKKQVPGRGAPPRPKIK